MAPTNAANDAAVSFSINSQPHKVLKRAAGDDVGSDDVTSTTTLAEYLRRHQQLPGTKTMCREGMCGACVVNVTSVNPATGKPESRAVNSCMVPLQACGDWSIQTVEGIGNRKDGYHPVQARLAHMNGTQCGYCSPGMVMSMYSLLQSKGQPTPEQVEQAMDGNLCRCTGYRPILDAFKTFTGETDDSTKKLVRDIEEAAGCHGSSGANCKGTCAGCPRARTALTPAGSTWRVPSSLPQALADLSGLSVGGKTIRLVAGNTSTGVLDKYEAPADGYVSLLKIPELREVTGPEPAARSGRWNSSGAVFGAAVTLSQLITELEKLSGSAGYRHCAEMARHLRLVANTPVRNAATWAGNLMIKYKHRSFPSDVFLLLTAARATLKIAEGRKMEEISVEKLYEISMANKIIISMKLPALDDKYIFKSYKITPRAISAHAYVNAAFVVPYDSATGKVTERPTLLFGGISGQFVHAENTERFLTGRCLSEASTVSGALETLRGEVRPEPDPELADVSYRARLASHLLFKVMVHTLGDKVPAHLRSAGQDLTRDLMKGTQEFETDKTLWPVNQAIPKLEAEIQTSGEAEYLDDQHEAPGELHGYYVLATVGNAVISSIDASQALAMPGVQDFVTAKDVMGSNDNVLMGQFVTFFGALGLDGKMVPTDQLFADGRVRFCGQPIGLVVADNREVARRAAALVKVHYSQQERPVLTIKEALINQPEGRQQTKLCPANLKIGDADVALEQAPHRLSGEWEVGTQFHFTMEPQSVRVVPNEDGQLNVFSATQTIKDVVDAVSHAVNVPSNKINGQVRRIGGGYGGKITNSLPIASACAVAAVKLNRPVRVVLDIENMIDMCATRLPYLISYEAGYDDSGRLLALKMHLVMNLGHSNTLLGFIEAMDVIQRVKNLYHAEHWTVTPGTVTTNQCLYTACRAPGSVQAIAAIETVMNHIAHELRMDPWEVRKANFAVGNPKIPPTPQSEDANRVVSLMVSEMFEKADIMKRKADIDSFNKSNRWRKRALAMLPMNYHVAMMSKMVTLVSIYDKDGSVAVSHGGVEMGQGLNTKVAQVCAKELGIPLSTISVKPNNTLVNPNGFVTGGSVGSEMCSLAVRQACDQLKERLKPFRAPEGEPERPWQQVVQMASMMGTNLTAHTLQPPLESGYSVWGLTAAEVELDVLTGEYRFNRVDVYEDAGQSLSPWIDVGQVEGAFTMGMGLFLTEQYRYDPETGRKLTNRAWNYYPPTHKDMPRDFRVKLLKNNKNDVGIFNSKATGEPAVCMSHACLLAIQQAVAEARRDAGLNDWVTINAPSTVEYTETACETKPEMLVLS
ncbi:indole-3-acetaldehyde oxidase-like isoform X1 [Amphibalanus amphitrite]|uniref:indole-3-acetaldehyde oxidase-like isoform X1 n=1 Tax=Amphibalanus amphitrite TaxID=1232801 RepID=UPI001C917F2F|nr:indole-3-acetaldehyde oxidase-like isoform X1 [Amphibalanus amphitrite]